jgi:hypothetical protein
MVSTRLNHTSRALPGDFAIVVDAKLDRCNFTLYPRSDLHLSSNLCKRK